MFLSLFRAAGLDDRSPWGDFWFTPIGPRGVAGQRVSADSALQLAAVYACVRVLCESFAVLPARLYRPHFNGRGRQLVTDHWLVRLMRRPNPLQNAYEWREMLQGHLVLRGNAFCRIVEDGAGGIAQLVPLHPDRIKIEMMDSGEWRYRYTQGNGQAVTYRRDQIWHLRGLSSDGIVGLSPIDLARETVGSGLAAQEYGNRFFANDAQPGGGWIEFPGKFADKEARKTFRDSWAAAQSGANRHKTAVLEQGMKYHQITVSNKDSQFLEARGYNRSEIAGIFRVAPHLIGDLSRATFSNIEQQSIDHWQNTMLPWTERWEAAVESLLPPEEADALEFEFDYRALLRGDTASRGTYLHNMVLDGILTRNEARAIEGYDPIEGADELLVPLNEVPMSDVDPNGEQGAGEQLPDAAPSDPDEEGADARRALPAPAAAAAAGTPPDWRLAKVLRGNAQRMARRFAKAGLTPSDAPVLADALAVPLLRAFEWIECNATKDWTEPALADALEILALPTHEDAPQ